MKYYIDLIKLIDNKLLPLEKMNWWLLKYDEHYNNLSRKSNGVKFELPETIEPNENSKFLDVYRALDVISQLYRNEKYFKDELINFNKNRNNKTFVRDWILKNEKFGADVYVCFELDYLDYSKEAYHLNVYIPSSKKLKIFIARENFQSTIDFLQIFNKLYWI